MITRIAQAETAEQIALVRELFLEYGASLDFDLCFQNFDEELAALPGDYAPPGGRLLLACAPPATKGCVALRAIDDSTCEMKRLYVRPAFRKEGLGRRLVREVIDVAIAIGYRHMRLDTVLPLMSDATRLYRSFGFHEIAPYRPNPNPGALYLELDLRPRPES